MDVMNGKVVKELKAGFELMGKEMSNIKYSAPAIMEFGHAVEAAIYGGTGYHVLFDDYSTDDCEIHGIVYPFSIKIVDLNYGTSYWIAINPGILIRNAMIIDDSMNLVFPNEENDYEDHIGTMYSMVLSAVQAMLAIASISYLHVANKTITVADKHTDNNDGASSKSASRNIILESAIAKTKETFDRIIK